MLNMAALPELGREIQKRFLQIHDLCMRKSSASNLTETKSSNVPFIDSLRPKALQKEQERFQLWSVTLGLFDSGHSSLAYRLEDAVEAYDLIIDLLKDLNENLAEGRASCIVTVK